MACLGLKKGKPIPEEGRRPRFLFTVKHRERMLCHDSSRHFLQ